MPAAGAVKRLIAGVVEAAFAGVDLGLTIRFGAFGRMADRDPLGIGFEPASHSYCLLWSSPASALAAGRRCACLLTRATFSARPSRPNQEGPRADSWTREAEHCTGVTNAVVGGADGAAVDGVHCRCCCSLIVKEKL